MKNSIPEGIREAVAGIMRLDDSVMEFARSIDALFGVGQLDTRKPSPNCQPLPEDYTLPGAIGGLMVALSDLAHVCNASADVMARHVGEPVTRRCHDITTQDEPPAPATPSEEVPAQKTPGPAPTVRCVPPTEDGIAVAQFDMESGHWFTRDAESEDDGEPVPEVHETTPINGVHSPGVMQINRLPAESATPATPEKLVEARGRERRTSGKKRPPKDR